MQVVRLWPLKGQVERLAYRCREQKMTEGSSEKCINYSILTVSVGRHAVTAAQNSATLAFFATAECRHTTAASRFAPPEPITHL